jgi:hypothetical protein
MISITTKPIKKFQCQLCFRNNFDKPSPHKCFGGYRKRKIIWNIYYAPDKVVLIEKNSINNQYKNIMKNVLNIYSKASKSYGRKKSNF